MLRELRAKLSEPSGTAWDRYLTDNGITASALIEAIGREMAAGRWRPPQRVLDMTKQIDRERRSR